MLNTTNAEFSSIELWFTDQNSKQLEIQNCIDIIKMRHSKEPKYKKFVKGYGFLSFARKFGEKYGQKLMDTPIKTGTDAAKTAAKKIVQKIAEATVDLTGKKIANKIISVGKTKSKETEAKAKGIYIPPEKRQQVIDDLLLDIV